MSSTFAKSFRSAPVPATGGSMAGAKRPRSDEGAERSGEPEMKKKRGGKKHRAEDEPAAAAPAPAPAPAAAAAGGDGGKDGAKRFILFVGNIPWKATFAEVKQHFASCGRVLELRLLTKRAESRTQSDGRIQHKGCGFIEFETDGALRKAFGLHHTYLKGHGPDDVSTRNAANTDPNAPTERARKINVELTAGGGGSSDTRKQKIAAKNSALNVERHKRHERQAREARE